MENNTRRGLPRRRSWSSHKGCGHPNTKVERAKCRRKNEKTILVDGDPVELNITIVAKDDPSEEYIPPPPPKPAPVIIPDPDDIEKLIKSRKPRRPQPKQRGGILPPTPVTDPDQLAYKCEWVFKTGARKGDVCGAPILALGNPGCRSHARYFRPKK